MMSPWIRIKYQVFILAGIDEKPNKGNMSSTTWRHQAQAPVITVVTSMTIGNKGTPAEAGINLKHIPDRCHLPFSLFLRFYASYDAKSDSSLTFFSELYLLLDGHSKI